MYEKIEITLPTSEPLEVSWALPYNHLKSKMLNADEPYQLTPDDLKLLYDILPYSPAEDIKSQIFLWLEQVALSIQSEQLALVYNASIALRILVIYKNLPVETLDVLCHLMENEDNPKEIREKCFTAFYLSACFVKRGNVFLDRHKEFLQKAFNGEKVSDLDVRTKAAIGLLKCSVDELQLKACLLYLETTLEFTDNLFEEKLLAMQEVLQKCKALFLTDDTHKILEKPKEDKDFNQIAHVIIKYSERNKPIEAKSTQDHSEKSLDVLLSEIKQRQAKTFDKDELHRQYNDLVSAYNNKSTLIPNENPIYEWSKETCQSWSKSLKTQLVKASDPAFFPEMLAVIKRANELDARQQPRIAQLLSLLLLLNSKGKGRLIQIATGEGKTTIIAMFAAFKALQGQQVEVVTSSPILGELHALEKKSFFNLFDLTADCNWDEKATQLENGFKTCYAADIVYGDALTFQWDELRHFYEEEGTRGERKYQTLIVDEVDSLLIDDASNSAQLAGHKPAFEFLQPILAACWQELTRIHQGFRIKENKLYWQAGPKDKAHEIPDQHEFMVSCLSDYLKNVVTDSPVYIPKHLREFTLAQTKIWAESAFSAFYNYSLGKEYTLTTNSTGGHEIAPVDYNTGVIHANSHWPDGLHQFLQLKEGLKITVESLMACYISNMAYFKRYDILYGLTGTLGDLPEQKLLADTYGVDFVLMPSYKQTQLVEIEGLLATNAAEWLQKISESILEKTSNNRAILVICDSINSVEKIQKYLQENGFDPSKIKLYTRTDNDEAAGIASEITPGLVIIATNLAGRGTDIKTSLEVENSGGLHVCVTFMPQNLRVERQAFGRTARQGKRGDAQLIINQEEIFPLFEANGIDTTTIDNMLGLKDHRDTLESQRLHHVKTYEVQKIILKDKLFANFCALTKELGSKKNTKDRYKLKQIEELWGVWLHKMLGHLQQNANIDHDKMMSNFAEFESHAREIFKADDIRNPCYLISNGNELSCQKKPREAVDAYSKAIALDDVLAVHAYYNRARARIDLREPSYKEKAQSDLVEARRIITETLIPQIQSIPILASFVPGRSSNSSDNLANQANLKVVLLQKEVEHIDKTIHVLNHSSRDVEVRNYKQLSTAFSPTEKGYDSEIVELNMAGLEHFYEVAEVPPPRKNSVFGILCVAFLGLCEIVVGALCYATGNVLLGQALIKEGVNDVMYAVRSAIRGDFSWEAYKDQKAISVAITLATLGIDHIRARAALQREAVVTTAQQGAKETSKQVTLEQIRKENVAQARKFVVKTVINKTVQDVVSVAVDGLTGIAISEFEDDIKNLVKKNVWRELNRVEVKQAIEKLILAHKEGLIKRLALELIHPKQDRFQRIASAILKGIIAQQSAGAAALIRLANMHESLDKISSLTNDFSDEFAKKLLDAASDLPKADSEPPQDALSNRGQVMIDEIISIITQSIMGKLQSGIAGPILDQITSKPVQKIVGALENAWLPKFETEVFAGTGKEETNSKKKGRVNDETGSKELSNESSNDELDEMIEGSPKKSNTFNPQPRQKSVGVKKGNGGRTRFSKDGKQYTNLKKELSESAQKSKVTGKAEIRFFEGGKKGHGLYYVGRVDPVQGKLVIEAELGKQYQFNLDSGSVDFNTLGAMNYFVDAGSVEALIKGSLQGTPTSGSVSVHAGLGVMGPSTTEYLTLPNINIMGISLKVQAGANAGVGEKLTIGGSVGYDATRLKINGRLNFGFFKGLGIAGHLKMELGVDEGFGECMEKAYKDIYEGNLIAQDIAEKIKGGDMVEEWQRDYLDDTFDQVAAKAQAMRLMNTSP